MGFPHQSTLVLSQHLTIYRLNGSTKKNKPYNPKSQEIQGKTAISELCKDHKDSL